MNNELTGKLDQQGLKIKETMTEEYTIKRANSDNFWRKCKLIASLLDTHQDINPNLRGLFRDSF